MNVNKEQQEKAERWFIMLDDWGKGKISYQEYTVLLKELYK